MSLASNVGNRNHLSWYNVLHFGRNALEIKLIAKNFIEVIDAGNFTTSLIEIGCSNLK
jgi:hypothetical protein